MSTALGPRSPNPPPSRRRRATARRSARRRTARPRARIVVDDDLIEGQGTTGVFFAGLLAIARHRPWLAVVLLVAVVAAILALGTVPRAALARLLEAL
jgi:hypothetical protein